MNYKRPMICFNIVLTLVYFMNDGFYNGWQSFQLSMWALRPCHLFSSSTNCGDDILIPRAATNITFQPGTDVIVAGIRILLYQVKGAHNHAGSTKSTLQGVVFSKRALHWMQCIAIGNALNGIDAAILRLYCK